MDKEGSAHKPFVPLVQSRQKLMNLLRRSDHEGISLGKVVDYVKQERLYFGPGVDVLDYLFSLQSLQVVRLVQGKPTRIFYTGGL